MLFKKAIILLTCCSLVLAYVPQRVYAKSDEARLALESLPMQLLSDIATTPAASATTSRMIVNDQYTDATSAACGSIQYGQTVSGFLFGEEECHTFSAQLGDLVYAQLESSPTEQSHLSLSGPGVTTKTCSSSGSCQIFYETLSAGGVHTLTISGSGYYELFLGLLDAPPETIDYGKTVVSAISMPGEEDSYQFTGTAGDQVFTYINTPIGTEFNLTLFGPKGGSHSCISYEACLIDQMTLSATGLYTLLVYGSGSYTGTYSLTLGTPDPVPMTIGESKALAVTSSKPLTFQIDVPSGADNLFVTLVKNADWYWGNELELSHESQVVASVNSWEDQIIHLPAPTAGAYKLVVTGTGVGKLSVLASLPDLPLGQWVEGTILRQDGLAWYQVNVPVGQESLSFSVETLGLASRLKVYKDKIGGSPLWSSTGASMTLTIPSPAAGRYYAQLSDSAYVIGGTQERDHTIKADVVPLAGSECTQPVVSSFSPIQGGTYMPVTVVVSGLCFEQQSSVCLTRQGHSDVCADTVVVDNDGQQLSATFDLSGAAQGQWSLAVSASGSQTAVAAEPFAVESGGEPNLWVDITGREQFRIGRRQTYHISYGNSGPVDAYDVLLYVKVPATFEVNVELPHPPDDSINWGSIPLVVEMGSEKVLPLWLFRVGANSEDGFDLSLTLAKGEIGGQATITAELEHVVSEYAKTGNLDDIEESPVFLTLVQALSNSLDPMERANADSLSPASRNDIPVWLKTAILILGWGFVGAVAGFGLGWIIGGALKIGGLAETGLFIGSVVGTALGVLKDVVKTFRKLNRGLKLALIDSTSPEDKFGPTGFDPPDTPAAQREHWIPADRPLDYRIDFWNKEDALAATTDVIISDTLDADLDWSTFYFTEIGFLDWQVPLQPTQHFNVDVADVSIDLSPYYPGQPIVDMVVNVEGSFDSAAGYIEWRFHALDPITRQPPENPYAGFLPPYTASGWEVGWVEFSVDQKTDLASGTVIQNQAFVTFDQNKPNPAPKDGPFVNTVDSTPPTSAAQISTISEPCKSIIVSWRANDDQSGSGVHGVDLFVDDLADSNPPYLWSGDVQGSSALFNGTQGSNYGFFTRARDNVGNLESAPESMTFDIQATINAHCLFVPTVLVK
jgi:hypothetical protein